MRSDDLCDKIDEDDVENAPVTGALAFSAAVIMMVVLLCGFYWAAYKASKAPLPIDPPPISTSK